MTAIDCTDCYLAIAIGDGVKRALIRHFAGFIGSALAANDLAARSDADRDRIDREAWRLSARVLHDVEAELEGALDETLLVPDPQKTVQEILAAAVATAVTDVESDYLGDDVFGFAGLLEKLGRDRVGADR